VDHPLGRMPRPCARGDTRPWMRWWPGWPSGADPGGAAAEPARCGRGWRRAAEAGAGYAAVLELVMRDVLPFTAGRIIGTSRSCQLYQLAGRAGGADRGGGNPTAARGWSRRADPGRARVIDWFQGLARAAAGTAGLLSPAVRRLTDALLVARRRRRAVRGQRAVRLDRRIVAGPDGQGDGPSAGQVGCCPHDERWRLAPENRRRRGPPGPDSGGLRSRYAHAGSKTPAVDPLDLLAGVCAAERLWLHVGRGVTAGFAGAHGKAGRCWPGLERPTRSALDPQVAVQPMEVRQRPDPRRGTAGADVCHSPITWATSGPRRRRGQPGGPRACSCPAGSARSKVWMSVRTFGWPRSARPSSSAGLAGLAGSHWSRAPAADLAARRSSASSGSAGVAGLRRSRNRAAAARELSERWSGPVRPGVGTRLAGRAAIRLCVLNPNSTEDGVRSVIAHFGDAPAPRPAGDRPGREASENGRRGRRRPGRRVLRAAPLLGRAGRRRCCRSQGRGGTVDVAAGAEVIAGGTRTGPSNLILAGVSRCHRRAADKNQRAGDHFGELARTDWGGGYGLRRRPP